MEIKDRKLTIESHFVLEGIKYEITEKKRVIKLPLNQQSKLLSKYLQRDIIESLYLLEDLWISEKIDESGDYYIMSYENAIDLNNHEKRLIGLPLENVEKLFITPNGIISSPEFSIEVSYMIDSKILKGAYKRSGSYIETINGDYQLSKEQYQIVKAIYEIKNYKTTIAKGALISQIREYKNCNDIELNSYFIDNEYIEPKEMKLDLVENKEEIDFKPYYSNVDSKLNEKIFEETGSFVSVGDKLSRKRAVLGEKTREQIEIANKLDKIKGEQVPAFIENPLQFIPSELDFNLEDFSERVKGLKSVVYRSNPSIVISGNGNDWFDITIRGIVETINGENSDIIESDEYLDILREGVLNNKKYVKYKDGWVKIEHDDQQFLNKVKQLEEVDSSKVNAKYIFDIFSNIEKVEYAEDSTLNENDISSNEVKIYPEPHILNAVLYDHQKIGYSWLRSVEEKKLGALLADDMGLGKTIQVIAFLGNLIEQERFRPSLLVLPASLIENWIKEFDKFLNKDIKMYIHRGSGRLRDEIRIAENDVVLTTYETLSRDQLLLGKIDFTTLIIDEAQKIKNVTTFVTNAVKAMNARYRIALTGTPVENNLLELWSIVDFIVPGYLGSMKNFKKNYQNPIEKEFDKNKSSELIAKIGPIFLRRVKNQVLKDLPSKEKHYIEVEMTSIQEELYELIIGEIKANQGKTVLPQLQKLLMLLSHSYLVKKHYDHKLNKIEHGSKKVEATIEIIKSIKRKNEKVIIFTRYKEMQRILKDEIATVFGVIPTIINGEVTNNREGIVSSFNNLNGFNVMILSPKAAGVGLNIVGANHVIHYTREWNPAIENQATDRAYRIGQTKNVHVYYPIVVAKDGITVEQRLNELLTQKRELFENTIIPTEKLSIKQDELVKGILN